MVVSSGKTEENVLSLIKLLNFPLNQCFVTFVLNVL